MRRGGVSSLQHPAWSIFQMLPFPGWCISPSSLSPLPSILLAPPRDPHYPALSPQGGSATLGCFETLRPRAGCHSFCGSAVEGHAFSPRCPECVSMVMKSSFILIVFCWEVGGRESRERRERFSKQGGIYQPRLTYCFVQCGRLAFKGDSPA